MRALLERTAGPCVTVRLELADEGASTIADLDALLVSLAKDVRAALPSGGALSIRVARADTHAAIDATVEGAVAGEVEGGGEGLELPSLCAIAKRDGARVAVEGRRVQVRLPVTAASERSRTAPRGKGETILVVEDSASLRRLLCRMLRDAGYRPLAAGSPEDALRICEAEAASIALMLTDVTMPQMSGRDLAVRVADRYGMRRVLFMSGHESDTVTKQGVGPDERLLQKPFAEADLLHAMRAVLEG